MRIWTFIAFICLAAAIVQCIQVADRVAHVAWFAYKFGVEPHLITVGSSMLIAFFGATAGFVGLGLAATDRLRRVESHFRFCSLLSVQMLIAGALVWGGLLASPLIQIVSR